MLEVLKHQTPKCLPKLCILDYQYCFATFYVENGVSAWIGMLKLVMKT